MQILHRMVQKKQKMSSEQQGGQRRPARLVLANRKVTTHQTVTLYDCAEQKSISKVSACQLVRTGYGRRRREEDIRFMALGQGIWGRSWELDKNISWSVSLFLAVTVDGAARWNVPGAWMAMLAQDLSERRTSQGGNWTNDSFSMNHPNERTIWNSTDLWFVCLTLHLSTVYKH